MLINHERSASLESRCNALLPRQARWAVTPKPAGRSTAGGELVVPPARWRDCQRVIMRRAAARHDDEAGRLRLRRDAISSTRRHSSVKATRTEARAAS